ncbi:PKD domain-containing protein [Mumia zhuanghuii]|uniref:PKD domain-containing protein n=2 Tax=Mumia TaxID=1546255 RepID=A0ABW1QGY7_9ACTN|nr:MULTISPECIES: PKD domain-containing protein [Mumia]KAA1422788.1 PKD domain-containing protein [Mumia zhuanghuii]
MFTQSFQQHAGRRTRSVARLAAVAALTAAVLVPAAPALADSQPADPTDPATPTTVTSDALPTVQINGVVWAQAIAGNRVYAGGSFTNARPAGSPAGSNTVARSHLLAYDVQTGVLVSNFAPTLNAQVTAVAVSPNGARVYVGGNFTTVNGQTRRRIAAFDAASGALIASFAPSVNGSVDAIAATNTTVYAGGSFLGVGNQDRYNVAAFSATNGALLDWAPVTAGGTVEALAINPEGTKVAVGGSFTSLNGSSNPGYGLGMVDATTGANLPMGANTVIRNGTVDGAILTLRADADNVYGAGYTYGKSGGTLEGVFAADWDGGDLTWINDCHGDSYDILPQGDVIYQAGHFHYCENIGGFIQGDGGVGSYPYNRGTAMSKAATRTATWEPDQGRYYSYLGQPAPEQLTWFPDLNAGSYTGQSQGPWSLAGNSNYVVMGGEFTRVNGANQQGLVRYAMRGQAPNDQGPQLGGASFPLKAVSSKPGEVHVTFGANYDRDNENLTYRLYRQTQNAAGLIDTRVVRTPYWRLPVQGFTDTGQPPGSTRQYRVTATDPAGNVAQSPWVSVTVATANTSSAYREAVQRSQPDHYWRFSEPTGTAGDLVGFTALNVNAGVTRPANGAIGGDSDPAATFSGTTTGYATTPATGNPLDVLTVEAWFKTTSTTGGKIIGWGNRNDRNSSKADRHVYMDNTGRIHFGVKPDQTRKVVTSPGTYNNGQWHHVAATLGPDGMKLYLDGTKVADRADVTVGEHLSRGFWRVGGDTLNNWPSASSSAFFAGDIDEAAVYSSVLSDSEIAAHYAAATGAPIPNLPPTAAFPTPTIDGLKVTVNGSTSSDSDGTIASHAWTFGDGTTASGATATRTFEAAGTYTITLTVTDDDGATHQTSRQVTVAPPPPNQPPTASFTTPTDGLTVNPNGSGSSDTDGTVQAYAWTFGDGGTATGVNPTHTYAAAGTYPVTLTVTDDDGATASLTKDVTVAGAPAPFARDLFARTVADGWGSAEIGGAWTRSGSATNFSVSSGSGKIRMGTPGAGPGMSLNGVSSSSTDLTLTTSVDKAATGGGTYLSFHPRRIANGDHYFADVRLVAGGTVSLSIGKIVAGAETALASGTITGLSVAAGEALQVRVAASGTSPTTLRAKVWKAGTAEPAAWRLTATDTAASLQTAGGLGLGTYLSSSATNAPVVASFDDLVARTE